MTGEHMKAMMQAQDAWDSESVELARLVSATRKVYNKACSERQDGARVWQKLCDTEQAAQARAYDANDRMNEHLETERPS